ncbi:MAG: hypothetical protein KJ592_00270 [Nanoarchaeota archaeon]|nr:hypothetical protein [Nanoarchaeota archaeon]
MFECVSLIWLSDFGAWDFRGLVGFSRIGIFVFITNWVNTTQFAVMGFLFFDLA